MASIVLRVRLIGGEHTDVTYEAPDRAKEELADHVIDLLSHEDGVLRCSHGGRLIVLFARGVASLEVAPRGAIL